MAESSAREEIIALHPVFPADPHGILDPGIRWFPADEAFREKRADQLMPRLVSMGEPSGIKPMIDRTLKFPMEKVKNRFNPVSRHGA